MMINEKYKWFISIFTLIASIIFLISVSFFSKASVYGHNKSIENVLNKNEVTDISIDIDKSDWQWLKDNAIKEEYRKCNITITGQTYYNVGIRPKGNYSLSSVAADSSTDRYSFKIKFDEYVKGQTYNGMKSIALNNMIQDNTYMKEYISYDLFNFMDIAVPEMSYSNIKINNEDWGLYIAIESIDERYLENNFGTSEGNLYKPEPVSLDGMNLKSVGHDLINAEQGADVDKPSVINFESEDPQGADFVYLGDDIDHYSTMRNSAVFKRTTDADFKRVINMLKNLNNGTNVEEVLDVDEILKYLAVNTYLVNIDGYYGDMYHNYFLYENNGKCQVLPWDLNLSFGGFAEIALKCSKNQSKSSLIINYPIDYPVAGNIEDMPLVGRLLEVDEYRERYHTYLKEIAENYFRSGHYSELVNKLDSIINNYVKEDRTSFCTYEQYEDSIPQMIKFGEDRTKSILSQLNEEQPSIVYGNVETSADTSLLTSKRD